MNMGKLIKSIDEWVEQEKKERKALAEFKLEPTKTGATMGEPLEWIGSSTCKEKVK